MGYELRSGGTIENHFGPSFTEASTTESSKPTSFTHPLLPLGYAGHVRSIASEALAELILSR